MTYYVIFHINDLGKGAVLVREIRNLQADPGEGFVHIEVLANSDGVLEFQNGMAIETEV